MQERGGVFVAEEAEGDEGDDPNLWIGVGGGEAKGGDDAGIFDADGRFHDFHPFDAERICDFGEEDIESASVVEPSEGEGGDDLGGAVFGLEGGEVGGGCGASGEFEKRATGETADIGVAVGEHSKEIGDRGGIGPTSEKASGSGAGEPIGILARLAEEGESFGGGKNLGCFEGGASDGGVGILEGGTQEGCGSGAGGGLEGEGAEGESTDGGGGVVEGLAVGLGGGVGLEDLVGLGSSEFGLPCEKVEVEAFLAEIEAIGKLAKGGGERFLGLGEVPLLIKLVDLACEAGIGAGAGAEGEG